MKYPKTALSFPEQADRLLARGLVADRTQLVERLSAVNYYRLSAYWYTFRIDGDTDDRLIPGTTLTTVWSRYVFDRQLRLLVMDAIERVEVAIRTQIVNRHVLEHGPFGYLDRATLPGMSVEDYVKQFSGYLRDNSKVMLWHCYSGQSYNAFDNNHTKTSLINMCLKALGPKRAVGGMIKKVLFTEGEAPSLESGGSIVLERNP